MEKKIKNECKKCGHECHCLDVLHTDVYGICPCDTCECDDPKNSERNVCHVNKGERQDELQIYSIINCVDGGLGSVRWTGRL